MNHLLLVICLALGSSHLLQASAMGANDKVVLAITGSGSRGTSTIINTCKVNANVEIKTVFDDRDIDALWISTPEQWHALATVWACQA